ncbi:hypothetical protein [Sphingomicrobium sediminis]|uniref:Uncharacterized protein n=1 Tax=Sphingomicrobium sediminis TaxID=2950949 RepID=A0A9X2EJ10_9SPHN|nr:hypothetical protein [Sphingomicrobium sediminis]MCM8558412.1 hypothetical protein [Sphingomicrobium sediminis]
MTQNIWLFVVGGGALALLLVYIFVIKSNKDSDVPIERTEKATHDLYEAEHEAAEKREGEI